MMDSKSWQGKLKIKTLSPIHVGTGERLQRPELEFDIRKSAIVRLDTEGFLSDSTISVQQKERYFSTTKPDQTIKSLRAKMGERYKMKPASGLRLGSEVREAIKISGDRPYLPGSSLKGAIRTALAWNLFYYLTDDEKNTALNHAGKENREKFKANTLEKMLFSSGMRGDAKSDAMKSLMVRDSAPLKEMQFFLYDLYTKRNGREERDRRGPFALEAIPVGTILIIDLKVDGYFLNSEDNYQPADYAAGALLDPNTFAGAIRHFSRFVAEKEHKFYQTIGLGQVARFFERENLLPIGFGTGWNTKTVGTFLNADQIHQAKIRFRKGAPPPRSRRVAIDNNNNPVLPLGWAQFELEVA